MRAQRRKSIVIRNISLAAAALLGCAAAGRADGQAPDPGRMWHQALWLAPFAEKSDKSVRWPEAVRMLNALKTGGMMTGGGWFGPSELGRGWAWLRDRFDADKDGRVTRKEFAGAAELFDRLDRDRDGAVTAEDFDWSPSSAFLKQVAQARQWFSGLDADSNGRVSRQEWDKLFDRLSKGKDHLTPEDLQALLAKPAAPPKDKKGGGGMPSQETLFKGLLAGDLGSPYEGPRPGEPAPDFKLQTHDGRRVVKLSELRGKPVVLLFGNFT
jgi:Ca2+-binding EF-hand superfamily protein